jgi:hypothetical protein
MKRASCTLRKIGFTRGQTTCSCAGNTGITELQITAKDEPDELDHDSQTNATIVTICLHISQHTQTVQPLEAKTTEIKTSLWQSLNG